MTREIPLTRATRISDGPAFRGGVRPIIATFRFDRDRDDVMRKAKDALRGTNVYVTEDFSRKVRREKE